MLGKYMACKRGVYKDPPKEFSDVDKLRELENVPVMPRCFRSIIPNKPKRKRVSSAAPFGRTNHVEPQLP